MNKHHLGDTAISNGRVKHMLKESPYGCAGVTGGYGFDQAKIIRNVSPKIHLSVDKKLSQMKEEIYRL